VEAKNSYDYSARSQGVQILCATIPVIPLAPSTTVIAEKVIIEWTKPTDNGTPITGYTILIKEADGDFS